MKMKMGQGILMGILLLSGWGCVHKPKKELVNLRIFLQTSPNFPERDIFQVVANSPRPFTFWVSSVPELTERDVVAVQTVTTSSGPHIGLTFSGHGRFILESMTGSNRGKFMAVMMNSEIVAAINIQEINNTGKLIFIAEGSEDHIEKLIAGLQATLQDSAGRGGAATKE